MKLLKLGLLILFAGSLYYLASPSGEKPQARVGEALQTNEASGKWEAISDDRSPVSITVTPIELGVKSEEWRFEVILDTHSGSLDNDLEQVASLVDDEGSASLPIAWEGAAPGGHHRDGILVFPSIKPTPNYVELKLSNIGGISERSFRWEMNRGVLGQL